jgi:hypothetical protein
MENPMKRLLGTIILAICLLAPVVAQATNNTSTAVTTRSLGIWGDWTVTWSGVTTTASTCIPYTTAYKFSNLGIACVGTTGAADFYGATIALFGSNDGGTNWFALTGVDGSTAITFTTNGAANVSNVPVQQVKWTISGGNSGGTTSVKVILQGQR